MATITACDPKRCPMQVIRDGSAIAAELMLILSAPASKIAPASSSLRTPPPTVNGTNSCFAVRRTVSIKVFRFWCVAVMSSRTTSSAPASLCALASSAGSPASRRLRNFVPFTTRPASTSKQAMIRLVSMYKILGNFSSQVYEVLQDLQSNRSRLLRVKLNAEQVVLFHCGREPAPVLAFRRGGSQQRHTVGVREINVRTIRDPVQQSRLVIVDLQAVPSHMRGFHAGREAAA